MSIIEEIKAQRAAMLTEEQKRMLLDGIKSQLTTRDYAIVDGAAHYSTKWESRQIGCSTYASAPFKYHPAIADWLRSLGFRTSRYYNKRGVDNGLMVTM